MYRLGLEAILGIKRTGNTLHINPVIPPTWDGFEVRYKFGTSVYLIDVHNPEHVSQNTNQILLDGKVIKGDFVPLVDDKSEHKVVVTMGIKHEL
jgi:cellobiose phosphorylase